MPALSSASYVSRNVTLPASAAKRRAAVAPGSRHDRPLSPGHWAHSSKHATAACGGRRTGWTDRWKPYRYTDPAKSLTVPSFADLL